MFNEDIERKLFENWCYKNCLNIDRRVDMGINDYVDDFVDAAWEGWKAAKRNIIPMNVIKHDCEDIYMNDFGDLVISQGTELYLKLIED